MTGRMALMLVLRDDALAGDVRRAEAEPVWDEPEDGIWVQGPDPYVLGLGA